MYAVVVTFQIKAGQIEAFMPAMLQNARTSLTQEPGCHRFDICTDPGRANEVFLYELYTDRSAFEAHLASAYFKTFDAHVAEMIERKDIRTYAEVAS
ncbi:putative quinol monooxygenase [Aestuariibius insulae]|uniref:putative quinol monooxygenase n=1 Tax=Aestuariibius insulae TaxID=2058287 RepID=UPI00345E4DE5